MRQMFLCPKCGSENAMSNRFCVACGTRLAAGLQQSPRTCSSCGTPNDPQYKFCGACGTELAEASQESAKVCFKCEAENPLGNKFCGQCGAKLGIGCPNCGAIVLPDSRYCPNCAYLCGEGRHGEA